MFPVAERHLHGVLQVHLTLEKSHGLCDDTYQIRGTLGPEIQAPQCRALFISQTAGRSFVPYRAESTWYIQEHPSH